MSGKIYLHLLLFCGILCQGIFATLSDKDTRLSSDILVRKRRVINRLPQRRYPTWIRNVNYIVKIQEENRYICAGVILSHYTVLTAAPCVRHEISIYTVLSGATTNARSNIHNITSKVTHYGNPPHESIDGIALITVDPLFEYSSKTGSIHLRRGYVFAGVEVTVSGWGYQYPPKPGMENRYKLRTITLPTMNHEECQNAYRGHFRITEKYICTYCAQQYCARGDSGAPLVFNHSLIGIHVYKGEFSIPKNPDVYLDLQQPGYRQWIVENTLLL